jgi:DNA-binding transcriptional regulator YiaG
LPEGKVESCSLKVHLRSVPDQFAQEVLVNTLMTGSEARAIRRMLRLSAAKLAEILLINESSIYRYEWRERDPVPPMYALSLRKLLDDRHRGAGAGQPARNRLAV